MEYTSVSIYFLILAIYFTSKEAESLLENIPRRVRPFPFVKPKGRIENIGPEERILYRQHEPFLHGKNITLPPPQVRNYNSAIEKPKSPYSLTFPPMPKPNRAPEFKRIEFNMESAASTPISDSLDDITQLDFNIPPSNPQFGGDTNDFVQSFMNCASKMPMCVVLPISNHDCFLQCLLQSYEVTKNLLPSLKTVVSSFCNKVQSTLQSKDTEKHEHVGSSGTKRKLKSYLASAGVELGEFDKLSSLWVKSLPLKVVRSASFDEDLKQLKVVAKDMVTRVGANSINCDQSDKLSSIHSRLVGLFYKNPRILDVLFGGFFMSSKAATVVHGPFSPIFEAFAAGMKVATSAECGLIYFSKQGQRLSCPYDLHSSKRGIQEFQLNHDNCVP